jgi:TolA-binding protein
MLPRAPDHPVLARRLADTYAELARAAEGTSVGRNAHRSAARYYEVVSKEAPQSTHRDEAAYYMALEHELEGDRPNARRAYYELIKEFPGSTTIPYAYFAFGEMFLAEAEGDPSKEQLAEQAFREVLKFPPLQNPLYTEAQSRLAEIALRRKGSGLRRP